MIDKLHFISQPDALGSPMPAIERALAAGCKWIQLRLKDEPKEMVLRYAITAKALCEKHQAMLIVNDHPEIALKTGANGVHLGLQDMPIQQARSIVGPRLIIGGTANTFEHILQRAAEGVDYIGLGPLKFTTTKKNLSPVLSHAGYRKLMEKVRQANISLPIIAIGGITLEDIPSLMEAGLYGVAVSGALTRATNPPYLIENMYRLLDPQIKQPC
ncbi:thiamine phosphate synthase [Pedobacter immunditicola]|uniref:thiamine phosphate synthase n=1 Tax=Pedobacter immunditicola TaxID=3133440 RepID=UPI0030A48F10